MHNTMSDREIPQAAHLSNAVTVRTKESQAAADTLAAWMRFQSLRIARDLGIIDSEQFWMALGAQ